MSGLTFAIQKSKDKAKVILGDLKRKQGQHVNVKKIAKQLGLTVTESSFKDSSIAGFLQRDTKSIVVNADNSIQRRRFTIAHEIGHYVLHMSESLHVDLHGTASAVYFRDAESSKATQLIEIEANQFAAELLMPTDEIFTLAKEQYSKNKPMDDIVEDLAVIYKVSTAAMAIKLGVAAAR